MTDLLPFMQDRALTPDERRRMQQRGPKAAGYAAPPGTGPAGETCGSCGHLARRRFAKVYLKCGLMEAHWTGGTGTDVRAKSPACRNWTKAPEPEKPSKRPKSSPKTLPPPTEQERAIAAEAARALRAALDDPATTGTRSSMHVDLARPRRGEWWTTWANLPGFVQVNGRYRHECLPGWEYARSEIRAEMIPDLEALAERGVRPTEATSGGGDRGLR